MTQADSPDAQPFRAIVTAEDFASTMVEKPIEDLREASAWAASARFLKAARSSEAAGDAASERVYGLLLGLCQMHLRPSDRADPWGARQQNAQFRMMVPGDVRGEQSAVLQKLLVGLQHPVLRARLADVVWTNNGSEKLAAEIAVDTYTAIAQSLLAGSLTASHSNDALVLTEALPCIQRALQIARATTKRGRPLPDTVSSLLVTAYRRAKAERAFVAFTELAEVGLHYELLVEADVAADAEVVGGAAGESYSLAARRVWQLGSHLYDKLGDREGRKRCQMGAIRETLHMCAQVASAGAEAFWVMQALQALEHVDGEEAFEADLERELRRLQRTSAKQRVGIPFGIDVSVDREEIERLFAKGSLASALARFACLAQSSEPSELRDAARARVKAAPLASMLGVLHEDGEGKPLTHTAGATEGGEPDEGWFRTQIADLEAERRLRAVAGRIEPARLILSVRFTVVEAHLRPIISASPFVPPGHEHLFLLGCLRFLQGDFMSAAHILLPQLEGGMRHLLKVNGVEPVKRFSSTSTEEDMDLGDMLARKRSDLEDILTPALVAEIEQLFDTRPGPRLRHQLAHSHVSAGDCFGADMVYAMWLIFRLVAVFVLPIWDEVIGREIDACG